ncbi:unnamed protein product (macronuclear) [Paramecium tetraurelia]|uniref:TNFR-Cys domain-containing protein n=1 Tax=Paramecium tetraurelia TaxID=5888 RepID=A0DWH5_PARTE|nr:uncharacterized protein GSPATT00021034001 [Paramecium tetraurelia]CAK87392.1 unnamed protein product [Paramecium tetraurelia]|eukprot:XP_001454789.1 hypothetical protein (macronuclear) [Paramecium tetraurelia strain d4-2]
MFLFILLSYALACSDQNCVECNQPTICTACVSPLILSNNQCVFNCPSNYYPDIVNNVRQCLKCNDKCLECFDGSPSGCTKCMKPLRLMCGNCIDSVADSGCSDCSSQCITCFGRTSSECYLCKLPNFHSPNTDSCELICEYPLYGDVNDFQCKNFCPQGTYGQPITRQCLPNCPDPYFKNELKTNCVKECPMGTYPQDKSCLTCHTTCETCSGGKSTDCIFCKEGYFMYNQQCGYCENLQYSNNETRTCVDFITYSLNILEAHDSTIVFEISFSSGINPDTLDLKSQIDVMNIDSSQYQMTLSSVQDDQFFVITLDFDISHRNTQISCNFTNNIMNENNTPILLSTAVQNLEIPAQFIPPNQEANSNTINTYMIISYLSYFCFLFLLCLLLRTQRRMFYLIINTLQFIQVMIFINFTFSTLTLNSLQLLDVVNLRRIPALGISYDGTSLHFFNTPIYNQIPNNNFLYNAGYYYNFIANGGIQILGILIIFWIIWAISFILHNFILINNKIETLKFYRTMLEGSSDLLVRVNEFLYFPLILISILQLWGYDFSSDINIASFVLSIVTILYYLIYFRSVYKSQFLDIDQQEMENKYFTFFADFKQSNEIKKNYEFINYFLKSSTACSLILLNNFPFVQFSISFSLISLYFILLIQRRPYLRNIMNYSAIFGYLIIIGLYITSIISEIEYQSKINDIAITNNYVEKQYIFGLSFMILIQIVLGFYAITFSYNKFQDYLKFLDKKPDWGKSFLQKMEKFMFSDKIQEVEMGNISLTN